MCDSSVTKACSFYLLNSSNILRVAPYLLLLLPLIQPFSNNIVFVTVLQTHASSV